jgi:hypothetical protein
VLVSIRSLLNAEESVVDIEAIGIILFDSIGIGRTPRFCDGLRKYSPIFNEIVRYSPIKDAIVGDQLRDYSLRSALMRQLRNNSFVRDILEDDSVLIWTLVNVIGAEWLEVLRLMELDVSNESLDIHLLDDDHSELERKMKKADLFRENLTMLKDTLGVIIIEGTLSSKTKPGTRAFEMMKDLEVDFKELVSSTEAYIGRLSQRLSIFASVIAIEESRKAIKQADNIGCVIIRSSLQKSFLNSRLIIPCRALTSLATFKSLCPSSLRFSE